MMIKAIYYAKTYDNNGKVVKADERGKVVYILDIDTANRSATVAFPVNEDECTFKIVGLGALTIIDETITPLYFSPVPMLKSKKPAPNVKDFTV